MNAWCRVSCDFSRGSGVGSRVSFPVALLLEAGKCYRPRHGSCGCRLGGKNERGTEQIPLSSPGVWEGESCL
jgi:hypothetical protein